jgi:hypothetical protein
VLRTGLSAVKLAFDRASQTVAITASRSARLGIGARPIPDVPPKKDIHTFRQIERRGIHDVSIPCLCPCTTSLYIGQFFVSIAGWTTYDDNAEKR